MPWTIVAPQAGGAAFRALVPRIMQRAPSTNLGTPLESVFRATMKRTDTSILSRAQKGALGQGRTRLTMLRAGFEELPARLPGNQGFDGVWVKAGSRGRIGDIVITESKFSSTGRLTLNNTAKMGPQLSRRWIRGNIQRMLGSPDPATASTGRLLFNNRMMIRAKTAVLNPQGIQRFSAH